MSIPTVRGLAIEGELTVITAADQFQRLRSLLTEASRSEDDLKVDLSRVTDMDTAGLQLLLLLRREANRMGLRVTFSDPSQAVRDVLGVVRLFPDLDGVFQPEAGSARIRETR